MSLMHGKYFDVPSFSGADGNGKRSFFKSTAQWDPQINRVLSGDGVRWLPNVTSIPIVCERGGEERGGSYGAGGAGGGVGVGGERRRYATQAEEDDALFDEDARGEGVSDEEDGFARMEVGR